MVSLTRENKTASITFPEVSIILKKAVIEKPESGRKRSRNQTMQTINILPCFKR